MVTSTIPPRNNSTRHVQQSYFERQSSNRYQGRSQRYRDDPDEDTTSVNDDVEEAGSFEDEEASEEDGEDDEATPLLPLFSAAHLGKCQKQDGFQ